MDLEILSMTVLFATIGVLLWRDRRIDKNKVEFNHGIVIRRMYRGRKALDAMVSKHKRFLRIFGDIGVAIAVVTAVVGTALLVIFPVVFQMKSFALVLPTVSSYRYPGPIISIPIWYWMVAVFVIMVCHETMHAIMSRLAGISIDSYGLIFLLVLPIGAFVDPDMKKVIKLKMSDKLRIYAAGSFGNFIAGLIIFLLFFSSIWASSQIMHSSGVKFEATTLNTPAHEVGLSGIIYEIDGLKIGDRDDLQDVLKRTSPGKTVSVLTSEGEYTLTTIESPYTPNISYLGIENAREVYKYSFGPFVGDYVPDYFVDLVIIWYNLLSWLFTLSIGIAIVNLLPMKPLDGGHIFEELAKKYSGKYWKRLTEVTSVFVAIMLILNLFFFDIIEFLLSMIQ
jgi:membrane-associated protease RseP (regulator of RpoE activity)